MYTDAAMLTMFHHFLGLAFSVQVCKTIPMGPSDKKIDLVLYPNGTVPNTMES
jgi:5-formyltetrahydrofolate cyclo-ligase